jgi:pyruvate,water dikinase
MVRADAAGVAFTAHPVTGARHQAVVTATRGLGIGLVDGSTTGEEWLVDGGAAARVRGEAAVLDARRAAEVAALAREVEARLGGAPQDVEWAYAGERLHLLQARPMTALPPAVAWEPPVPGGWMRHFRLGEYLPEPVTPLFETWMIDRIERQFARAQERGCGLRVHGPHHVVVNGWYFYSPLGTSGPALFLGVLLRRPRFMWAMAQAKDHPEVMERAFVAREYLPDWEGRVLPRYRELVATAEARVAAAAPPELRALVDDIADVAGDYLWSIAMVGGFAWKVEGSLARFCRRHLAAALPDGHQPLVAGLDPPRALPPHAVQSLDWVRPTVGEGGPAAPPDAERWRRLVAGRARAEAACRAALAHKPRRLRDFERLLGLAQRYARLREQQVALFTLGWPVARRAVLRLGDDAAARGLIEHAEDVFFLRHEELLGSEPRRAEVAERRRLWHEQRRLSPPLIVGTLPGFLRKMMLDTVESMRSAAPDAPGLLVGMPASPGRATGTARVLHDPGEGHRLHEGEVLVARLTTPAWTPLFARAAAVITDGGSVAAHASLVAREYGIPAVVGTGNATARVRDGDRVVVDGSAGVVRLA